VVAFEQPPPRGARRQETGRALEEQRRALAAGDGGAQVLEVVVAGAGLERLGETFAEGLEDPEAQIVGEADLGKAVALRQVVEGEEVEQREVAQRIDDGPFSRGVANRLRPRRVDGDRIEEAAVQPAQQGVRLVARGQRAQRRLELVELGRRRRLVVATSVALVRSIRRGHLGNEIKRNGGLNAMKHASGAP
jgi:hypothetical protein